MKIFTIKKSIILKVIIILLFLFIITKTVVSFGMQHYYNTDFTTGLVTASALNVRSGPRY